MTIENESRQIESIDDTIASGETSEVRRRLLRAGLAAGPVLMAVKSRSVLACGGSYGGGTGTKCRVTCSAFASIKAANAAGITLSHKPVNAYPCKSHVEWKNCNHPTPFGDKKNCYFHGASNKPKRTALSWDCKTWGGDPNYGPQQGTYYKAQTGCRYAGFARKNTDQDDRTLQEMLSCSDPLARHLVATILNKAGGYDPDNILPTQAQCRTIWQQNGAWTPPNCTTAWTRADTIAWFDLCYGTCS